MISEKLAIIPSITSKFTSVHYAYLLIFKKKITMVRNPNKKKDTKYIYIMPSKLNDNVTEIVILKI